MRHRHLTKLWSAALAAAAGLLIISASAPGARAQTNDGEPGAQPPAKPSGPVQLLPKTLRREPAAPERKPDTKTQQPVDPDAFAVWLDKARKQAMAAGIARSVIDKAFAGVTFNAKVIELDGSQPEFETPIWEYIGKRITRESLTRGKARLFLNKKLFERVEAAYGIPPAVLVAIWRLETNYGRNMGDFKVIEALATLAYAGRRRGFWLVQLNAALRIIERGYVPLTKMVGSWAGAMGHTQFIPEAYLRWSIDFDEDGKRDLWGSTADVFASTANYLKQAGWRAEQSWGLEVKLPAGFDWNLADPKVRRSASDWRALGILTVDGKPLPKLGGLGSILLPTGHKGPAFLVFGNYRALLRYNNSTSYALTVALLAQRLSGGPGVAASWPVTSTPLSRKDKEELQRRLTAAGHNTGGVDGKIGPMTRSAIRAFQAKVKMPADGHASIELLTLLRNHRGAKRK